MHAIFGIVQASLSTDMVTEVLSILDFQTLLRNRVVCKEWHIMCTFAIDSKRANSGISQSFEINQELCNAVARYKGNNPHVAEELASRYGWPINKWDVSKVEDFSCIFKGKLTFNEVISSWNTTQVTRMADMFRGAEAFN
jgi:hypothetical protein